jgi:hypothetical protein
VAGPLAAPLIALLLVAAAAIALAMQRRRQHGRLVGSFAPEAPEADILYFTGVSCTVCHVAQRPAIARLHQLVGDLAVREIDVAADPQLARAYGVMTLPTTVVLGSLGRIVAVNAGFATETVLLAQVEQARTLPAATAVA